MNEPDVLEKYQEKVLNFLAIKEAIRKYKERVLNILDQIDEPYTFKEVAEALNEAEEGEV